MNIENSLRQYLDIQIDQYLRTVEDHPELERMLYSEVAIIKSCLDYCFVELTLGQLERIAKVNKIHFSVKET